MEIPILYKYEPKKLADFSHDKSTLHFIKEMININNINIILFGAPGTGKTALLNAIVYEYYNGVVKAWERKGKEEKEKEIKISDEIIQSICG